MCCIFTCCGWMVDLIQRLWTFTMSCIISSAVCCSLITASMSGVALGYNYSLAEYIDLKETNVSVYLKRGIFDDEIADDMEWRRRGHQPVAGQIGEDNLLTASDESSTTLRSGRRLDDSIYESNDRNNFEGSLMRLTAKAPDYSITSSTNGVPLHEIIREYPPGSVDVLKAVQGAINSKKAEVVARQMSKEKQEPPRSDVNSILRPVSGDPRRVMKFDVPPYEAPSTSNSLRLAVPEDRINELSKWRILKPAPKSTPINIYYTDSMLGYTYPSLATPRPGPARPTKSRPVQRTRPSPTRKSHTPSRTAEPKLPKSIDEEMESFKEKLMDDKFDEPGANDDEFLRKIKTSLKKPSDDYDEQIKGLPLRKKRQINVLATGNNLLANRNKKNVQDDLIKDSTFNSKIIHLLKATSLHVLHKFPDASFTNSELSNKLGNDRNDKVYLKSSRG